MDWCANLVDLVAVERIGCVFIKGSLLAHDSKFCMARYVVGAMANCRDVFAKRVGSGNQRAGVTSHVI